jgi:hypothetical protein
MRVIETHSGGGQYDCLELLLPSDRSAASKPRIVLNRNGSAHFLTEAGTECSPGWTDFWADFMANDDPLQTMLRLEESAQIDSPRRLSPSTPAVLTYRFIAAFLSHSVFGREDWECRNGFLDTSGSKCAVRGDWFAAFPGAAERLVQPADDDLLGQPAYRFWFLVRGDRPSLCLETNGTAWDKEGLEFDLMRLHRARRRIWPVVSFVAKDLLP